MTALTWNEIKARAVSFSKEWANEGYGDGEAKSFLELRLRCNTMSCSTKSAVNLYYTSQEDHGADWYQEGVGHSHMKQPDICS